MISTTYTKIYSKYFVPSDLTSGRNRTSGSANEDRNCRLYKVPTNPETIECSANHWYSAQNCCPNSGLKTVCTCSLVGTLGQSIPIFKSSMVATRMANCTLSLDTTLEYVRLVGGPTCDHKQQIALSQSGPVSIRSSYDINEFGCMRCRFSFFQYIFRAGMTCFIYL